MPEPALRLSTSAAAWIAATALAQRQAHTYVTRRQTHSFAGCPHELHAVS